MEDLDVQLLDVDFIANALQQTSLQNSWFVDWNLPKELTVLDTNEDAFSTPVPRE